MTAHRDPHTPTTTRVKGKPQATPRQRTIREERELGGIGLHTGKATRIRLRPAEANTGIVLRRVDLDGSPEVPATVDSVHSTDRGTTLARGDVLVHTVEHMLAAVAAHQVDNLVIDIEGIEPPAGDGSARPYEALITSAGIREQDAPARVIRPTEPVTIREGDASFVVAPGPDYRVSTTIEFDHPLVGRQYGSFLIDPESFEAELAEARTFGFLHEVERLRSRGLAMGGSTLNALVLTDEGIADDVQLRFPDEFVRHKTLDIVGDLALVGARINAHIVAERPGHRGNVALARTLLERFGNGSDSGNGRRLDIQDILNYLPHRYPFLLVDRVVDYVERKRIVGIKNVSINEPFFVGHFPGHPIMPGVLVIEAMAQVGGLLLMDALENPDAKVVYFMSLNNVKWRRPVTPGDQIRFEVEVVQIRGTTCKMKGVGRVDGKVVAEAEMMARVVDR